MSWLVIAAFIFGVGFGAMLMVAWMTSRPDPAPRPARVPLARLADPRPLPGEREPFPDTGPLLIWSDSMAAAQSITREVEEMIRAAERKARPYR